MSSSSILHIFAFIYSLDANSFYINVVDKGPTLIDEFLSVTLDTGLVNNWTNFDWNSTLINTLANGLTPSFLRFGGTGEDYIIYNMTSNSEQNENVMTASQLNELGSFCSKNGWKILFGLNEQQRYPNNSWNGSNTEELINYIINTKQYDIIHGYELGNEPNVYYKISEWNIVSPEQLSNDFKILYNLIYSKYSTLHENNNISIPKLFGPDITTNACNNNQWVYLNGFINQTTQIDNIYNLNGITWHHYYGYGPNYTLSDFINVTILDSLINKMITANSIVYGYDSLQNIILGETSSSWGGGTGNISSSFAAGFMWLDKLCIASIHGYYSVIRQVFWGGNYGLIGNGTKYDYKPNPDYYTSYLFKNLIGTNVIYVDGEFEYNRYVRVYGFCTRTTEQGSIYNYKKGSITIVMLNLYNNSITFNLNWGNNMCNDENQNCYYDEYHLTSYPAILNSRDIYLNGNPILMKTDNAIPKLIPIQKEYNSTIQMTSLSYGYIVLANANAPACV